MFKTIIIGLVITVVSLVAFTFVGNMNKSTTNADNPTHEVEEDGDKVKVDISGEINHPGEYSIYPSETLGDLITMAGGVTTKADPDAYNSSILIGTYTSFYIAPISEMPAVCVDTEIEKVNINNASAEELQDVGFNSSQASNIITYRNENGAFQAIEDILKVKGIGEATFNKVKNKITIS